MKIGKTKMVVLSMLVTTVILLFQGEVRSDLPTIELSWNANKETDLMGYEVLCGTQSLAYTTVIDVGDTTTFDFTNLVPGVKYYFAVKAYNTSLLYSKPSGEVAITIPAINTFRDINFEIAGSNVSINGNMITMIVMPSERGATETNYVGYEVFDVFAGEVIDIYWRAEFSTFSTSTYGNFPVYIVNYDTGERVSDEKDVIYGPNGRTAHITFTVPYDFSAKLIFDNPNAGSANIYTPLISIGKSSEYAQLSYLQASKLAAKILSGRNSTVFEWGLSESDALAVVLGEKIAPIRYRVCITRVPNGWDIADPTRIVLSEFETADTLVKIDNVPNTSSCYPGYSLTIIPIYEVYGAEFEGNPITESYIPSDNTPLRELNWNKKVSSDDVLTVTGNIGKSVVDEKNTSRALANTAASYETITAADAAAIRYDSLKSATYKLTIVPDNP